MCDSHRFYKSSVGLYGLLTGQLFGFRGYHEGSARLYGWFRGALLALRGLYSTHGFVLYELIIFYEIKTTSPVEPCRALVKYATRTQEHK